MIGNCKCYIFMLLFKMLVFYLKFEVLPIRSFAGMRSHVCRYAGTLWEAPIADGTTKRLLASVRPNVGCQIGGLGEALVAVGASLNKWHLCKVFGINSKYKLDLVNCLDYALIFCIFPLTSNHCNKNKYVYSTLNNRLDGAVYFLNSHSVC